MKKILIGFLLSILPIYSFISWQYVYSNFPRATQSVKLSEFNRMFFDIPINQTIFTMVNILFAFAAIYYLIKFQNINIVAIKIISVTIIVLLFFITAYNFWGLL